MLDHGHSCPVGRLSEYASLNVGPVTVQIGICAGCDQVIARRYVITGPGPGPWTVLNEGKETS